MTRWPSPARGGAAVAALAVGLSMVRPDPCRACGQGAMSPVPRLAASVDPGLEAVLDELTPLAYSDGGAADEDRPPHVRSASAVRRWGSGLLIVQDDVNVLAHHASGAQTRALLLPPGADGRRAFDDERGNKHVKMDLEACAALPDGRLVVLGSGATSARELVVVLGAADETRVVQARELYAGLRAAYLFSGSELNVEGALVVGGVLRLFQRGNGAPRDGLEPVNASGDLPLEAFLAWLDAGGSAPEPVGVVQYDLGRAGSSPYGFTDAALDSDGRIAFLACAEDSPDVVRDGEVAGCRFGYIEGALVRMAQIRHGDGQQTRLKLEGLERRDDGSGLWDVVVDPDSPQQAALLGVLRVSERLEPQAGPRRR